MTHVTTSAVQGVTASQGAPAAIDFSKPNVILPFFSCVVYSDDALKAAIAENYCEIYIFSKNGLYRRTQLTHGRSVTVPCPALPAGTPTVKLPDTKQDVSGFFPAGKIPKKFLDQIVAFFREVMKENNGVNLEAQAFVIWNPEFGYHIRVPEQTVSGASVSYKWENFVGPNDVVVLDVHSHNSMGSFFSSTDDRDDTGNCTISMVIGKLTATTYEYVARFNLPGNMKINTLKVEDIFASEGDNFEVPKEWLSQVKRETARTTVYGGRGAAWDAYNYGGNRTGVVPNPNVNRKTSLLSAEDEEVLAQFGYPFANEGKGGDDAPFAHRPKKGRKIQKSTRLPRKNR